MNEQIIIAMKPLDNNFVSNALEYGVAGININGSRIKTSKQDLEKFKRLVGFNNIQSIGGKGKYGGGKIMDRTEYDGSKGRFPSNILLQHHPECVKIGAKKVKGITGGGRKKSPIRKGGVHADYKGHQTVGREQSYIDYADDEGNETIENWNCHPECPIRILDEQSGILHSGARDNRNNNPYKGPSGWKGTNAKGVYSSSSGGASRFFYQVKNINETNIDKEINMEVNTLFNEDCKETMKKMDKNSIPFIITDPPYLLEFMGKEFDKQHHLHEGENTGQKMQKWHTEWLKEAYRVLKPGGFLVAFGGTRTYHRLACAMEDVGFEIRDTMQWIYGSGFPKSLDISKAIDKRGERHNFFDVVRKMLTDSLNKSGYSLKQINEKMGMATTGSGMAGHWFANITQQTLPTKEQWFKLKNILHFPDDFDEIFEKCITPHDRPIIGKDMNWGKKGIYGIGDDEWNITKPATNEAKKWDGWGTALKPAYEPIVIGMKPLSSSFVDNALNEGVAGINIDGSRVATDKKIDDMLRITVRKERESGQLWKEKSGFKNENNDYSGVREDGRFPANVILQHHEECKKIGTKKVKVHKGYVGEQNQMPGSGRTMGKGWHGKRIIVAHSDKDGMETIEEWECHEDCPVRIMNEQSGILSQAGNIRDSNIPASPMFKIGKVTKNPKYYDDSGGAARFYYTAKASKSERNVGLEGMEKKILAKSRGAQQAIKDGKTEYLQDHIGFNRIQEMENVHPTVKPIDLMRYLVNMFSTPDGGVVYDPFAGSASTLIACKILGREYIGSEMDKEYYEIAKKRLQYDWVTWWARGKKDDFVKVKEEIKNKFFE